MEDDDYHGQGKMTYANGDVYEGAWENDEYHGQGTLTYTDGDVYEGAWKNGECYGQGKMTYADGDVYEGEWENDKRHGQGKCTDTEGNIYEGAWKDGWRHGQGTMTYADGRVYEGDWKDDKCIPSIFQLYLIRREVDPGSFDLPRSVLGQSLYKLGYTSSNAAKRAKKLNGQGDTRYDVVGEWPVEPKGRTVRKRKRSMEVIETNYIDYIELRKGEHKAGCGNEYYWLYDETAKAAAAKAAAAATARVVTAHDAPQEQA